jgi:competence protein ComEC
MNNPLYLLNFACLLFMAGIFCSVNLELAPFAAGALTLGALIWQFLRKNWRESLAWLFIGAVFLGAGLVRMAAFAEGGASVLESYVGREAEIEGEILSGREFVSGERRIFYYAVAAKRLRYGEKAIKISENVDVSCAAKEDEPLGRAGDRLTAYGKISPIGFYKNEGQLDRRQMKKLQSISVKLSARTAEVARTEEITAARCVENFRAGIKKSMEQAMNKQDSAALFAMLFGGYDGISREVLDAFSITGIIHILSVSGSHITLLAACAAKAARFLRLPPFIRVAAIFAAVLGYGAAAGFVPPVVRSAVMGLSVFVAEALGREKEAKLTLVYAAFIMLIVKPALLFDISFELSFAATFGLIYLAPKIAAALWFLPHFMAVSFSVTTAAQLAALPFMSWYFNTVSISAFLANLLLVPLIEALIMAVLAILSVGALLPFLAKAALALSALLLGVVVEGARLLAHLPLASLRVPTLDICGGVIFYGILYGVFFIDNNFFSKGKKLLLVLTIAIVWQIYLLLPSDGALHFIDVGQGDSALVITPHHKAVLFDTGGIRDSDFDVGERVILPYLRHYGIGEVEYVFLTHAHADHAGGAGALVRRGMAKHIVTAKEAASLYAQSMHVAPSVIEKARLKAAAGESFEIDGLTVSVIEGGDYSAEGAGNEASCVYKGELAGYSFLITGDLTAAGEMSLLAKNSAVRSDILKVAHHGSKTSTTAEFVARTAPCYAVISVGKDNNFGHPNAAVLDRLEKGGAKIYRTDEQGAVIFEFKKSGIAVSYYNEAREKQ